MQHAGKEDLPVTYRELLHGAVGWAALYREQNIQPGEVIVLIMQHSLELVYAYFGAILHGAIPSIMPYLTEKLSPERYRADLTSLVGITQPAAIVTFPEFEAEVRSALHEGDSVRAVILTGQDTRCHPALQPTAWPGTAGLTEAKADGNIFPGGHVGKRPGNLKSAGDAGETTPVRRPGGNVLALEVDGAARGLGLAADNAHQGSFAGAVGTDDADDFLFSDLEINIPQYPLGTQNGFNLPEF